MTKTVRPIHVFHTQNRHESAVLSNQGLIYFTDMVRRLGELDKENSPNPPQLLLPVDPDESLMRETATTTTAAADIVVADDCFRDLKPGFWLPISLTTRCGHTSFNAQRASATASPTRGAASKEMLKAAVAIHPVVTQPPALPADLAAPRLRCPTEPSTGAPRSSVSRRISAIAELRSQRKIQTPPLPPPPPPLPRPCARSSGAATANAVAVAAKPLVPSTPRGDSPPGRPLRWLSASGGHSDRTGNPSKLKPAASPNAPPPSTAKRLEPFSPQPGGPNVRALTLSESWELGELPRLRLQHRHGARGNNGNNNGVWNNLQVDCLPICKPMPRLTANTSSSVNLPQRSSDIAESRSGLSGLRTTAAAAAASDSPAPGRASLREKRELLSPAIVPSGTKEPLKEVSGRRPPSVVIEPAAAPLRGAPSASEPSGADQNAMAKGETASGSSCQRKAAPNYSSKGDTTAANEVNANDSTANRLSPEDAAINDAVRLTQITLRPPANESKNVAHDLTDGMLVCTPLAGGARSVTMLPESPGASRLPNGSLSAASRRTRPFSVISSGSSKPSKYSIVTDGSSEYPDPFTGASPSFLQRLMDLSTQENETIRWERMRATRRKPRFLSKQD